MLMCHCVKDKTATPILKIIQADGRIDDEYRFGSEEGYHRFSFSPEPDGSKARVAL